MPADLDWALLNKQIANYKLEYSQQAGRDIGTPATVDKLLATRDQLSTYCQDRGLDREVLIRAYLFKEDLPDEHGKNQLEGELRRFVASRRCIPPRDIGEICPQDALNYLHENNLPSNGTLARGIASRMRFSLKRAVKDRKRCLRFAAAWRQGAIANGPL